MLDATIQGHGVAAIAPPEAAVAPPEAAVAPPEAAVAPPEAAVAPPEAAVAPPEAAVAPPEYVRDPALNLLWRTGFDGICYGEGADEELRILNAVRTARDRSTFSAELAAAITGWASEYHFSRERHCIVRPLGIAPGDRVLELGCGCGAITRYLGEIGAEVTAVEGAPLRARIAAERCRDLCNVTVVADDMLRLACADRYDWVLLVGVLEYAPVFCDDPDPVAQVLRAAAAMLAPQGRLVVAIENQFGLKYFNGCGEDHLGIPFHGVQGLYAARTARTFGRAELAAYVRDAGLPEVEFHYPFPDYKLPRIVLSEAALSDPGFDAAGTLAYVQARDYRGNPNRLFDEALVAREAARNGLLGELSNSFLLVAARQGRAGSGVLALAFAARRNAEFATQTQFVRVDGAIRVQKQRLIPERSGRRRFADGSTLENSAGDNPYVPGQLAYWYVSLARARRGDLAAIVEAFIPWFAFLLTQAKLGGRHLADFTLPGHFIDATPFNLVETGAGFVPIDLEWRIDRDIPLGWVVTRSVVHCLWGIAGFERAAVAIADVVAALCARHGLAVTPDEIARWLDRENELQDLSSGAMLPDCAGGLMSRQLVPAEHLTEQDARIGELTRTVADLNVRIDHIYRSRSWRYSYPIRMAGRLLHGGAPERPEAAPNAGTANSSPPGLGSDRAQVSNFPGGLRGLLPSAVKRYGCAVLAVVAAVAITHLMIAAGIRVPRMLLYIAAVAVATRAGGPGPGFFALAASVAAILLAAPSFSKFFHDVAMMERLGVFLACAVIGIVVSLPRAPDGTSPGIRTPQGR